MIEDVWDETNSGEKVEKRMIWVVESDGGSVIGVLEVECKSDGGGGGGV